MATTYPISTQPNGFVTTNTALAAISVATLTENAVATTLGGTAVGDGLGGTFFFKAGSSRTSDSVNVLATPTTGRWEKMNGFSGVGPTTSSLTGYAETFALLSGFAALTYTLPPTANVLNKIVTVKCLTTGTVNIRCGNATDLIVNDGLGAAFTAPVAVVTSTLTGGQAFNFLAGAGNRYYRIDKVGGAI